MPAKLHVVPPAPAPAKERVRQRMRAMPRPPEMLECRCGSRELIEVKSGVMFKNGKASGGAKQLLCACCMRRGERVVVA